MPRRRHKAAPDPWQITPLALAAQAVPVSLPARAAKPAKARKPRLAPPAAKRARVVASDDLGGFVRAAKGDPRLSAWEAGFVNDIGALLGDRDAVLLSDKQHAVIEQIAAKVRAPFQDHDPDDLAEPAFDDTRDLEVERTQEIIELCDASLSLKG